MFRNKTVTKILSLIAAICLWMYVVGEVDPETKGKVGDIPVHFTNTDELAKNGLAVVNEEENTISVVLKGKRSDVNEIKKSGLTAHVDVSDCEKGRNTKDIEITVPDNVSLENVSDEQLTFTVEKLDEQSKPVEIEFYGTSSSELSPYIIECEPEEILVRGAESSVKKIKAVRGQISIDDVPEEKSRKINVELEAVNKNGNIINGVKLEYGKAAVQVQMLQTKTVKLQIIKENLDDSILIEKMAVPENIILAGPESVMEDIDKIEGVLDMTGVDESATLPIRIDLPESVYLFEKDNQPTAEIIVKAE